MNDSAIDLSKEFKWTVSAVNAFEQRFAESGVGYAWMTAPGNVTAISQLVWMARLHKDTSAEPESGIAAMQEYMDGGANLGTITDAIGEAGIRDGFLADTTPKKKSGKS